jgi:atypical dual specificity phosphatase
MKLDWIEQDALAANSTPVSARDIQWLHQQGIRAIVTLTEDALTSYSDVDSQLFEDLQITYLHVPVFDFQAPQLQQVEQIQSFIDQMREQTKPVFIHCYAGVGRTGTILHGYYLLKGLSLEAAKEKVLTTRKLARFDELSDVQQSFLNALALKLNSA